MIQAEVLTITHTHTHTLYHSLNKPKFSPTNHNNNDHQGTMSESEKERIRGRETAGVGHWESHNPEWESGIEISGTQCPSPDALLGT